MRASLTAGVAAAMLTLAATAVEVDGIVARVGSDSILRSDVQNEMQRVGARGGLTFSDVLNEMIDRKLVLKAAAESKMTIQEWIVEGRVRELINKMFGGDRNKLIETLRQQKISYPEWYAKIKEDMIVSAMRWNVVDKNVSASPTLMKEEYDAHPERYVRDYKVSVSVIMLKPEEGGKREEILAALKDKDFMDLGGKKYEDVNPTELFKPEIVAEIEKMPKGTVSKWIELDGWNFLLRKDSESKGEKLTFADAYDAIEASVRAAESKRLFLAWIERLRAETYIKVF